MTKKYRRTHMFVVNREVKIQQEIDKPREKKN